MFALEGKEPKTVIKYCLRKMKNKKGNRIISWATSQLFLNFMVWNMRSLTKKLQELCKRYTGNSVKESAKIFLTLYLPYFKVMTRNSSSTLYGNDLLKRVQWHCYSAT